MVCSRIMVIDDDELVNAVISEYLEFDGYSVQSARNGRDGLAMIHHDPPDLVITDIIMTQVDGLTVLRELQESHPGLPVIVISGGDRTFVVKHLLDVAKISGANRILAKPFTREELLTAVQDLLPS